MAYLGNPALVLAAQDNLPVANYQYPSDPTVSINPRKLPCSWLNTTSGEIFVCTDNTAGANVWVNAKGLITEYTLDGATASIEYKPKYDSIINIDFRIGSGLTTNPLLLINNDSNVSNYVGRYIFDLSGTRTVGSSTDCFSGALLRSSIGKVIVSKTNDNDVFIKTSYMDYDSDGSSMRLMEKYIVYTNLSGAFETINITTQSTDLFTVGTKFSIEEVGIN